MASCANETIPLNGKAVDADTISGRQLEGLNFACMESSSGSSCMVESQDWVGSNMIYNADGKRPLEELSETKSPLKLAKEHWQMNNR